MDNLNLIISLIGAAAWFPFFYELAKKRKIYIKILTIYGTPGISYGPPTNIITGIGYFLKMAFYSKNKNLQIKKISGSIKYKNSNQEKNILIFYNSDFTYTKSPTERYKINISGLNFLQCTPFYEKDKNYISYLTFIVENSHELIFEYLILNIHTPDDEIIIYKINGDEINPDDLSTDLSDFKRI